MLKYLLKHYTIAGMAAWLMLTTTAQANLVKKPLKSAPRVVVNPEEELIQNLRRKIIKYQLSKGFYRKYVDPEEERKSTEQIIAPLPSLYNDLNYKNVILPPNISQLFYRPPNTHLAPAMFESDLEFMLFKLASNPVKLEDLRLFLGKSTVIDQLDVNHDTPLFYAINNHNLYGVKVFLHYGASINHINKFGMTPLHVAVIANDFTIAELLLNNQATIDLQDNNGNTPLMYAVQTGRLDLTNLLLYHGANVNLLNDEEETALDMAFNLRYIEIANLLMQNHARIIKRKR